MSNFSASTKMVVRSLNKSTLPLKKKLNEIDAKIAKLNEEKVNITSSLSSIESSILEVSGGFTAAEVLDLQVDNSGPLTVVSEEEIVEASPDDLPFNY